MLPTSFARGTVLKCLFPYDTNPNRPGLQPHYCLFIEEVAIAELRYVAVCYGTSRLDDDLIRTHRGCILSVPSQFIKGNMPGIVTHFIADHVALIALSKEWIYFHFHARLDFIREQKDPQRQRLYKDFEVFERTMQLSALDAVQYFSETGKAGLPFGKTLR